METFCHDDEYQFKNIHKKDRREFKGGSNNNNNNNIYFENVFIKKKKGFDNILYYHRTEGL